MVFASDLDGRVGYAVPLAPVRDLLGHRPGPARPVPDALSPVRVEPGRRAAR